MRAPSTKLAEFSSAIVVTLYATINGNSTGGSEKKDNGVLPWAVGGNVAKRQNVAGNRQPRAQPNEAGRGLQRAHIGIDGQDKTTT